MNTSLIGRAAVLIAAAISVLPAQNMASPAAGRWKTWVLASGGQMRLPAPANAAASAGELQWLKSFMASQDGAALQQMRYWDAGAPPYRWIEMISDRLRDGRLAVSPVSMRAYAVLSVAMYDAAVAAWDSKYAYNRSRPSAVDSAIRPRVEVPHSPSYPCEHSVVAGAAATVLAYLFPAEAAQFQSLAEEAGRSRLTAGVQYPSDVNAGLELGRAVGQKIVDSARADRTDSTWTGTVPTGAGMWTGTNPGFVTAPQWRPWVMSSPNEFRPGPPPAWNSPARAAELAELRAIARPFNTMAAAFFWQTTEGVHTWWYDYIARKMFETGMHRDTPRAARAYALMSLAQYDGIIASNDAKYTYWTLRPGQQDREFTTIFAAPNFPSYPSNHSVVSAAKAEVLAYLFPDDAAYLRQRGEEAGLSRLWAGIHFRSDHETGAAMGRALAAKVVALAEQDGSKPE